MVKKVLVDDVKQLPDLDTLANAYIYLQVLALPCRASPVLSPCKRGFHDTHATCMLCSTLPWAQLHAWRGAGFALLCQMTDDTWVEAFLTFMPPACCAVHRHGRN